MGMSLALYGEITFKRGRVEQSNYDGYRVLRIDESPPVTDVHIVAASIDVPSSGVGEPGLPPFAPALCNAIFAARASVSGACRSATSWLLENDFRGRGIASTPAASTQADQVVIELGCEIFGARNVL